MNCAAAACRFAIPFFGLLAATPCLAAAASCDKPAALHFAPGSSSGVQTGGIARGELACWTVSAKAGQTMSVTLVSPESNAVMQAYAPGWKVSKADTEFSFDGPALKGAAEGDDAPGWTGTLPANGKYLIVLGTTRGGGAYTMTVTIRAAH